MNNYRDDMNEVSDFDEDIKLREELIEEAKAMDPSLTWNDVSHQVANLKKRWKRISYWESAFEDTLSEEFDQYLDAFYAKRNESHKDNKAMKQDVIDRAKKLLVSDNMKQAIDEMNELMAQWKATGSSGKDSDDALWETFNTIRQEFFELKQKYYENLQTKFEEAQMIKKELIKKAASICDSQDWKVTGEHFRKLMEEWKAAGSAGRKYEDDLWNEFNASRQKFYEKRDAYYATLKEEFNKKYDAKKDLVNQAKDIAELKNYTKEQTEKMKLLNVEWKKIGSCGRDREDQIWNEFRSFMDDYFQGLKTFNDEKHAQWRQRLQEARNRKLDLIQKQKRQIKYMEFEIVGLLGQRAIDEMEEDIKETKEFIQQLEDEVKDIDASLNESK